MSVVKLKLALCSADEITRVSRLVSSATVIVPTVTFVTTCPSWPHSTARAGCGVVAVKATPRASALTRVTSRTPRSARNAGAMPHAGAMPDPPCPDLGAVAPLTNPSASIAKALVAIFVSS